MDLFKRIIGYLVLLVGLTAIVILVGYAVLSPSQWAF